MQELGIKHVHSKRTSAKYYSAGTLYKDSIMITFFVSTVYLVIIKSNLSFSHKI